MIDRDFQGLLEHSGLLSGLDPLSRTALGMHFQAARFAPGEVVLEAGETGDRMMLILSGQVEIHLPEQAGGQPLTELGPDSLLGEVAFFGRVGGRTATAVARGEVVAAELSRATYDHMVQVDPGAAETLEKLLLDVMLDRVADTNARMVALIGQHKDDALFQAEARMMARKL